MSRRASRAIVETINRLGQSNLASDLIVCLSLEMQCHMWNRCFIRLAEIDIFNEWGAPPDNPDYRLPFDWTQKLEREILAVPGAREALLRQVNVDIWKHHVAAGSWEAICRADCCCMDLKYAERIRHWLLTMS